MATAPWRCSQCGTVNEPVANSCRNCGKWPSLFDLEDSAAEDEVELEGFAEPEQLSTVEPPAPQEGAPAPEPATVEVETFEESEPPARRRRFEPPPTDPVLDEGEGKRPRWVNWIIPIGLLVYFVLSFALSNR